LCTSCLIKLDKEVLIEPDASALEKFATPVDCYFKEAVEDWNEWTAFMVEPQKIKGEENEDMWPIIDKVMKSANIAREDELIESISCHGLGVVAVDGPLGFFLVELTSTPFKLEGSTILFGCNVDPKTGRRDTMPTGSWVVRAKAYVGIHRATRWHEPVDPVVGESLYWLQHVVSGEVKAEAHSDDRPRKLTQQPAVRANKNNKEACLFLSPEMNQRLLEEVHVKGKMDYINFTEDDCVREKTAEELEEEAAESESDKESGEESDNEDGDR